MNADQSVLTPIDLQGKPPGYPERPRSRGSSMIDPPDLLRVALHRDAKGIYRILSADETPQASLWRVELYRRSGKTDWRGAAVYEWEASEK